MTIVFGLLIAIFAVFLLVGLVDPAKAKQDSRKMVVFVYGGLICGLFIAILVSPAISTEPNRPKMEDIVVRAQQVTDSAGLTEVLQQTVLAGTGSTDMSYRDLEIEANSLSISINVGEFFSESSLKYDTNNLSSTLIRVVYASQLSPNVIKVRFYADTTDRYGNTENSEVIQYSIDKETYAKINWTNFDSGILCEFLESEYLMAGTRGNSNCRVLTNID